MPRPLTAEALSTSPHVENLQPIQTICLFTDTLRYSATNLEYSWGLEKGKLDLSSKLNHVSVRADVAQLLKNREILLIPTSEILDRMVEYTDSVIYSEIDQRPKCFEVFPPGKYEYRLFSGTDQAPALFVQLSTGFDPVDCVYPNLPVLTLDVHPFFAMMQSAKGVMKVVNRGLPFQKPISMMVAMYSVITPLEFRQRPSIDSGSLTSGDSGDTEYTLSYDSEEEDLKIYSWLESTKECLPPDLHPEVKVMFDESDEYKGYVSPRSYVLETIS
ncbi:hypothetical protein BT96DRAFT_1009370 [Gymnopus androsaceus JB14]|uniref:Uncharacterized protein n=1 Tax=Gymnopus androsaceus JB14 TaxID=1447944 RepID=A0A6A4GCT3_9AGAR|nr:hypothetical protein BT96DRAFT_1009370 [Gymnopus androsaceus JB14]